MSDNKKLINRVSYYSYFGKNNIKERYTLNENRRKEGEDIHYYENQRIKARYHYRDGKLEGAFESYYEHGPMSRDSWELKGFLKEKGRYRNGQKHGTFFHYDEYGHLQKITIYTNDVLNGACKIYYPDGKRAQCIVFKNGKPDGIFLRYYPDGQLKAQGHYQDGKLSGTYEEYSKTGKLTKKGIYINGDFFDGKNPKSILKQIEKYQTDIMTLTRLLPRPVKVAKGKETLSHKKNENERQ